MIKFPSPKELERIRKNLDSGMASEILPSNAIPTQKVKFKLCGKFVIYKREHHISQKELADMVGIDEALMSKILHYHIKDFTADRLINILSKLYPDVELNVEVA